MSADSKILSHNLALAAEEWQKIATLFFSRQTGTPAGADPLNIAGAFSELYARLMSDPQKLAELQIGFWKDTLSLWRHTTSRLLGRDTVPAIEPDPRDKRFKDEAWQASTIYDFIKQSYLVTSRWAQKAVDSVEGIDPKTAHKIQFYTKQFIDAVAPSNFLATNPEAMRVTLDSNAENLVKGLRNLREDLERGQGSLRISMTDYSAFAVGKNLAMTPGKVVFQNDLMQLIQYSPTTETVHEVPLLVMPAWINKYYILDLQPENSLVKWLVDQGYTVFMISWVNPDEQQSDKGFEDYMLEGPLAALDAIEKATGEKQVSVMAYCLGGTLLSSTLAYLTAKKQADRIVSATYLTTMTDFSEAGDLSVFVDEEQLKLMEHRMSAKGYLDGQDMAITFNMLRSNDLIWSFVVNNYLLGKDPFPFDLLYWNSDSTRMPAQMHSFYLRNMYLEKKKKKKGGITLGGVPIDLTRIETPTYMLSTREDHIAPWKSTYKATQIFKGEVRFVLAASGHIAGVINPPAKKKYSHWVNDAKHPKDPETWFKEAEEVAGSWWPDWHRWIKPYQGKRVPARKPGNGKLKPVSDAPGSYVKEAA